MNRIIALCGLLLLGGCSGLAQIIGQLAANSPLAVVIRIFTLCGLLLLAGCSGQIGGVEAGKALCGQLNANNPLASAPAAVPTGQITFSAPAGTRAAMCVW